jgi:transcriptional regulator with XRE-family HTH domain
MNDIARALGANIRQARCRQDLTQAQMAELIGMSVEMYGRMERGGLLPSMEMFVKLCRALGVQAGQLVGFPRLPPRLRLIRGGS